jgi:hypothetical protein
MYKIILLGVMLMFNGCSGNTMKYYQGSEPKADIKEYFTGPIKAWGIVQNWRGHVVRRFDVEMIGSWQDDVGTLKETFHYYDGEVQHRTWTITKNSDNSYDGIAGDILGVAKGTLEGSAVNWHYSMDLPVDGKTYRLKFDDWMWQMKDGVLINRSYIKKFGLTVAELTIFMQKQGK